VRNGKAPPLNHVPRIRKIGVLSAVMERRLWVLDFYYKKRGTTSGRIGGKKKKA